MWKKCMLMHAPWNLIRNPNRFDIILTTNLFGDIISDEAAQVTGSIGLAPGCKYWGKFCFI